MRSRHFKWSTITRWQILRMLKTDPQLLQLKWSGWYGSFLKISGSSSIMAWHFWQIYLPKPRAFSRLWHGRHRCLKKKRKNTGFFSIGFQLSHMVLKHICLNKSEIYSNSSVYSSTIETIFSPGWLAVKLRLEWDNTCLPAFLTNPTSASTAWHISQQKQSGCQL